VTARKLHKARPRRNPTLQALMTHDEVARQLGMCRQRIVQLEASALRKSRVLRELFR
jgi:DNA-directed RNA polymerase sigma subunit (sigma70/sigma32)